MCGLILFSMALQIMKPQMVINHQYKERKMDYLTIESCENNFCTYLTKMQDMQKKIDSLLKYRIK